MRLEAAEALRSVRLHSLRASLSTLGVVVGVASFVGILAAAAGARQKTLAEIEQLGMRNVIVRAAALTADEASEAMRRGSPGLRVADGERLARLVPGVVRWAGVRELTTPVALDDSRAPPPVLSVGPEIFRIAGIEAMQGRLLAEDDVRQGRMVCVVGAAVARRLGRDGFVGASLGLGDTACRIVGVLRTRASQGPVQRVASRDLDGAILLPLETESLTEIVAEFGRSEDIMAALPLVRRSLAISHRGAADYRIVAAQELLQRAAKVRQRLTLLLAALATSSILVGAVGILSMMLVCVQERVREIGIRRAIGASGASIGRQFFFEALAIAASGVALGVLLGLVAAHGAGRFGADIVVEPWTMVLPALVALAVACGFGVYPALVAARLDPVTALREVA